MGAAAAQPTPSYLSLCCVQCVNLVSHSNLNNLPMMANPTEWRAAHIG
jgi:hypothetical protein